MSVSIVQGCAVPIANSVLGAKWYDRQIGVRLTMLGEPDTVAHLAHPVELMYGNERRAAPRDEDRDAEDHGFVHRPPPAAPHGNGSAKPTELPLASSEAGGITVAVARRCASTVFVALHEPFENNSPQIDRFRRVQQTDRGLVVAIAGKDVDDRVLLRYGAGADLAITLTGEGESFTFADHGLVRIAAEKVEVFGPVSAMTLKVASKPSLLVNGRRANATFADGFLMYAK